MRLDYIFWFVLFFLMLLTMYCLIRGPVPTDAYSRVIELKPAITTEIDMDRENLSFSNPLWDKIHEMEGEIEALKMQIQHIQFTLMPTPCPTITPFPKK